MKRKKRSISDKERLDWLARRKDGFRVMHIPGQKWFVVEADGLDSGGDTFRFAIDAAILSDRASRKEK